MLKLSRNALAEKGIFYNANKEQMKWDFITKLHQVQSRDILHLGNKLRGQHIKWRNHKMKVKMQPKLSAVPLPQP